MFFQERGDPDRGVTPKAVCATCPFRLWFECLDFGISNNEQYGVWGGLSERERRRLRVQWNRLDFALIRELRSNALEHSQSLRQEVAA